MANPARTLDDFANVQEDAMKALLRRFAAGPTQLVQDRLEMPTAPDARLHSLLREIDETVMPRRLTVLHDKKPLAELVIANRRLVSAQLIASAQSRGAGQSGLEDVRSCLMAISKSVGSLSMATELHTARIPSTDTTWSLAALKAAFNLEDAQACVTRLVRMIEPVAHACVPWSRSSTPQGGHGSENMRAFLQAHALRFCTRTKNRAKGARFSADKVEGVIVPLSATTVLVLAGVTDCGIAAIVPASEGFTIVSNWQKG
jgi:hypothetical protein